MRASAKWLEVYQETGAPSHIRGQPEYGSWMQYAPSSSITRQLIVFLSGTFLYVRFSKVAWLTGLETPRPETP
jgi:hypothetical protein